VADDGLRRAFSTWERPPVPAERVRVLADLAARVRALTETVLLTNTDDAVVAGAAAELAAVTDRLDVVRREVPVSFQVGEDRATQQLSSPVTGILNPFAPPVEILFEPDGSVLAEIEFGPVYEGPPGFVHGGISALVLDHLLGAAAAANGTPGMTAGLELRYRRPTPLGVKLRARAAVTRVEGRKTFVEGHLADIDGRPTVEATAVFILPAGLPAS
jgi:acyl-coenzyme A thioesterase PaaI-like protein